uniref:Uncharacterized protein n=1 Tax=Arundo donax TaxID=35708 RepID=A0A0A8XZN8_ARUDO
MPKDVIVFYSLTTDLFTPMILHLSQKGTVAIRGEPRGEHLD